MSEFFSGLMELNFVTVVYRVVLAFVIGGLVGIERSKHGRAAGLRTHILVCVGACLSSMIGVFLEEISPAGVVDPSRIAAQVIAGIGFLGAGSILIKNRDIITGLTTAAGMWTTGIIGLAIGFGFYEGAFVCALVTVIAVAFLNLIEVNKKREVRFYIELDDARKVNDVIDKLKSMDENIKILFVGGSKTGVGGNVGLYIKVEFGKKDDYKEAAHLILQNILKINHVVFSIQE